MLFQSTRNRETVSVKEALLNGLANDGGLYLPQTIPVLSKSFIHGLPKISMIEMATEVSYLFLKQSFSFEEVKQLVTDTLTFPFPIIEVEQDIYSLELFHGPTMAFKDVGARFMARLMSKLIPNKKIKIIVATSGDTGSAVAAGFYNVPGIEVYILYPQGRVSPLQEKQLTTWGNNIIPIEIQGTFDDCQHLVKQLLAANKMNDKFILSSANSINIGRLIPQMFYYFWIYSQLQYIGKPLVVSVPSGNFGNLTAGLLAQKMGLPISQFIASTNANNVFTQFLESGTFISKPSISTISNAMDVGNPSNFERMNALYNNDVEKFKKNISSYSFSDEQTKDAIYYLYNLNRYILDPHGAIGYLGIKNHLKTNNGITGVFLETAHPAKFIDVVEKTIQIQLPIPEKLEAFLYKEKKSIVVKPDFKVLNEILNTHC